MSDRSTKNKTGLVDTNSLPINPATEDKQDTILSRLTALVSLTPTEFDYITLAYDTAQNLTSAIYRIGGSGGTIVSTITLTYDSSGLLTNVALT